MSAEGSSPRVSRPLWISVLLLLLLALGCAAHEVWGPVRVLAQRLELRLVCPAQGVRGGALRCRVLVRDFETLQPARVYVAGVIKAPERYEQKLQPAFTDAAGEVSIDVRAPDARHARLEVVAKRGSDQALADYTVDLLQPLVGVVATDKPRYQPGQLIHMRAVTVASSGRPAAGVEVELAIVDPKDNQVLSQRGRTSSYGIFNADFRLAEAVLQGDYNVQLRGAAGAETIVAVEPYTLPKFHVEAGRVAATGKSTPQGKVVARHMFGEPVQGAKVAVYDQVGRDRVVVAEGHTDERGELSFAIDEAHAGRRLVASVSGDGIGVQEAVLQGTVPVAVASDLTVELSPQTPELVRAVRNHVYAVVTDALGKPAQATLELWPSKQRFSTDAGGVADLVVEPSANQSYVKLTVTAEDDHQGWGRRTQLLPVAHHDLAFTLETDRVVYAPGAKVVARLQAPIPGPIHLDVWHRGVVVGGATARIGAGSTSVALPVALPPDLVGRAELAAYRVAASGELLKQQLSVFVSAADQLSVNLAFERASYRPGETAQLSVDVKSPDGKPAQAALGLLGLDLAVRHDLARPPGFELLALKDDASGLREGLAERVWAVTSKLSESARVAAGSNVEDRRADVYDDWKSHRRKLLALASVLAGVLGLYWLVCLIRWRRVDSTPAIHRALALGWGLGCASLGAAVATSLHGRSQPVLYGWLAAAVLGAGLLGLAVWQLRAKAELRSALQVAVALCGLFAALQLLAYVGGGAPWLRHRPWLVELAGAVAMFAGVLWAQQRVRPLLLRTGLCLVVLVTALLASRSAIARFPTPLPEPAKSYEEDDEPEGGADSKEGGTGTRAKGEEGSMGNATSKRYAVQGPKDNADFLAPPALPPATRVRKYFPETLLWQPSLVTDATGHAQVAVPLADSITTWAVTASALSLSGAVGVNETSVRGFQEFFVDADVPAALSVGDELALPVVVYNYLEQRKSVTLRVEPSPGLTTSSEQVLSIGAHSSATARFRLRATATGAQSVTVRATAGDFSDALERPVEVYSGLYEVVDMTSGRVEGQTAARLVIPDAAQGTKLGLKLYRGSLSQIAEGLRGVFKRPHGCFEQTSSTTYPSVLALGFMRQMKVIAPQLEGEALGYILEGYQRLLTFEVPGGGFSIWGTAPADVMLTAYGLHELSDLSRVAYVDPKLIDRTRDWLLAQAKEGRFDDAQDDLTHTAFVVRALAAAQTPANALTRSLSLLEKQPSRDPYELALRTLALLSAGRKGPASELARQLPALAQGGYWKTKNTRTFYSYGRGREQETTALCVEALTKLGLAAELVDQATTWLGDQRTDEGTWASTAATVAAMRALLSGPSDNAGTQAIDVRANGKPAPSIEVSRGAFAPATLDLTGWVTRGENALDLSSAQPGRVRYQAVATYDLPWSAAAASSATGAFPFKVSYDQSRVRVGDGLACHVEVAWPREQRLEMPMIEVGVAPGTSVVQRSLLDLRAQGKVASFSVTRRHVVLYLPNSPEPSSFDLEFRAELPGRVHTPPSRAWGYYQSDVRALARPSELVIE